jgi:hypothetical protein
MQSHQHVPHIPAELLVRRGSAEAAAVPTAAQRGVRGSAAAAATGLGGRAGFGSVVETDGLKTPLLAGCGDDDGGDGSDAEQQ